ncbi:hypothetical protein D623_10002560, partial [Myotis brandtii]
SSTVIHGCVLSSQGAELYLGCAHRHVSGHADSALELLYVFCVFIVRVNPPDPIKPLSWGLLHPMHVVDGEGVSRSLAGDIHRGPRLPHLSPRLHQLHLEVNTCGEETGVGGNPP